MQDNKIHGKIHELFVHEANKTVYLEIDENKCSQNSLHGVQEIRQKASMKRQGIDMRRQHKRSIPFVILTPHLL